MAERIYTGDTAIIDSALYGEDGVSVLPATLVEWSFRKPDGTIISGGPQSIPTTDAVITVTDTAAPGVYSGKITFTLTDGSRRSLPQRFEVIDPLDTSDQATTDVDKVVDHAWMKLEDLFDSELGGPWLRDKTLVEFDQTKMKRLLPDALYNLNSIYQPATSYDDTNFPYTPHAPLLSQALLIETIYHLIRAYTEQPMPVGGGNITYFDRRDYLARWQSVLQKEEEKYLKWLDMFKRDQMGYGHTAILVGGYSNNWRVPRFMRSAYPFVWRW
jgi:hypothetical protein